MAVRSRLVALASAPCVMSAALRKVARRSPSSCRSRAMAGASRDIWFTPSSMRLARLGHGTFALVRIKVKALVTGHLTAKITQERERQAPGRGRQGHCLPGHGRSAALAAVAEPLLLTPGCRPAKRLRKREQCPNREPLVGRRHERPRVVPRAGRWVATAVRAGAPGSPTSASAASSPSPARTLRLCHCCTGGTGTRTRRPASPLATGRPRPRSYSRQPADSGVAADWTACAARR